MSLFNWFKMVVGGGVAVFHETADYKDEVSQPSVNPAEADTVDIPVQRTLRVYNDVGGIAVQFLTSEGLVLTVRTSIAANLLDNVKDGLRYGVAIPAYYYSLPVTGLPQGNTVRELLQVLNDRHLVECQNDHSYRIELAEGVVLL